ncbi:MAG: ABC-F family ATP-binding cassette domain-containing protein [Phycisphaerales bacterium]|mgnify:CR=1 FL=1|jgi:ATP-binding cassette subfamily F protein 3|nr:ABC-F family ATP-binding cassette domain-containing protein [Phycisphaerales bacterium]MDP7086890.1 ABC-F family ATP-binding cassette domain-containing protein [Phycisphaerales bacterium]MDP7188749.1 ABC-F family ATP-binding cassette domain-containing protein [Phycisphaerales bacterium]MDP7519613.1 ABC-F family ATP-binding cassette domain-containing protein [Phycisphaerales bacterium]MDP7573865.1 ABC-F family ATP-binding cassette domain-containing protein [Phycisphaerales bacterium]|tara:strand:- start:3481 stop:5382 length:1902 start_codon:yes stop_codon:yes gene_type:complete
MSLASVSSATVQFGNRIILDGVDLAIQEGSRIGLLGRNGTGKTTLLRLFAGTMQPDAGSIVIQRGLRVGLLDQHPKFPSGVTAREVAQNAFVRLDGIQMELDGIFEAMAVADGENLDRLLRRQSELQAMFEAEGGWSVDHRVEATLHGVGLLDSLLDLPAARLSGGEQSRLALAKLLLEAPDLLLLDEPTNHLDIEGRRWLEQFLRDSFGGTVVLVSHDRWLLDSICTQIVEVHRGRLESFPGNYTQYVSVRAERRLTEARAWDKQQDHIRREQSFIRKYKAGQRAKQARGRESKLKRFVEASEIERPESEIVAAMHLPPISRCGERVMTAERIGVTMGDRLLIAGLDLDIRRGDRIGIIGPNGAGKTTLVRCLLGELAVSAGRLDPGTGLNIGWFRQMHDHLDPELSVWEWVQRALAEAMGKPVGEQVARDLAGAFMFSGEDQDRLLGTLSGGERARAILAGLLGGGHNVLVLDEPSNHVDVATAERLEAVLSRGGPYLGTVVLVSHDRAMLEAICDRLIVLDGLGRAIVHEGTVSTWFAAEAASKPLVGGEVRAERLAPIKKKSSPLDRLSMTQLEDRIGQFETRLGELQTSMGNEAVWSDAEALAAVVAEQEAVSKDLAAHEQAWLDRGG